jgi:predicted RNA-binding protein YlxR (DUF448 family)
VAKTGKRRRKHVPQRTCVGCRTVQDKRALIRIVRTPEGVKVDLQGKEAGRGAYLHDKRSCWQLGLDGKLAHALKTELNEQDRQALIEFAENLPPEEETQQS